MIVRLFANESRKEGAEVHTVWRTGEKQTSKPATTPPNAFAQTRILLHTALWNLQTNKGTTTAAVEGNQIQSGVGLDWPRRAVVARRGCKQTKRARGVYSVSRTTPAERRRRRRRKDRFGPKHRR